MRLISVVSVIVQSNVYSGVPTCKGRVEGEQKLGPANGAHSTASTALNLICIVNLHSVSLLTSFIMFTLGAADCAKTNHNNDNPNIPIENILANLLCIYTYSR